MDEGLFESYMRKNAGFHLITIPKYRKKLTIEQRRKCLLNALENYCGTFIIWNCGWQLNKEERAMCLQSILDSGNIMKLLKCISSKLLDDEERKWALEKIPKEQRKKLIEDTKVMRISNDFYINYSKFFTIEELEYIQTNKNT